MLSKECGGGLGANVQDVYGDSPLHDACRFGHVAAADALVQNGANKNLKNKLGQTPLDLAAEHGYLEEFKGNWFTA